MIVTARLVLRQWKPSDLEPFAALNADPRVMEFFPATLAREQSDALAQRCAARIDEHGWGLWAAERRGRGQFIGYVGLSVPSPEMPFGPCVEVGWRLAFARLLHVGVERPLPGRDAASRHGAGACLLRPSVTSRGTRVAATLPVPDRPGTMVRRRRRGRRAGLARRPTSRAWRRREAGAGRPAVRPVSGGCPDGRSRATTARGMTTESILWRRLDGPGHDACRLEAGTSGWRLDGAAVFRHGREPARLTYCVDCDARWRTREGVVRGWVGAVSVDLVVRRTASGRWSLDGTDAPEVQGCEDLDLGFTPATNLLQLRRIALDVGRAADVPVAWLDVPAGTLSVLRQRYERRTTGTYWYEAPRFGYAAVLDVDAAGFARHYPGLWAAEA